MSKRSIIILLICLFTFPPTYLYLYLTQNQTHEYSVALNLYSEEKREKHCKEHQHLTRCFLKDFYNITRNANPYEKHKILDLQHQLFQKDMATLQNKRSKIEVLLLNIEMLHNYKKIRSNIKPTRKNLHLASQFFNKFYEDDYQKIDNLIKDTIQLIEKNYYSEVEEDEVLFGRFMFFQENYTQEQAW